ncbi:hypothetical protein K1719_016863 [Acacia pycnantha]|nr:hypothetical protein K1719_016863 [Acacia pycnantha]
MATLTDFLLPNHFYPFLLEKNMSGGASKSRPCSNHKTYGTWWNMGSLTSWTPLKKKRRAASTSKEAWLILRRNFKVIQR